MQRSPHPVTATEEEIQTLADLGYVPAKPKSNGDEDDNHARFEGSEGAEVYRIAKYSPTKWTISKVLVLDGYKFTQRVLTGGDFNNVVTYLENVI